MSARRLGSWAVAGLGALTALAGCGGGDAPTSASGGPAIVETVPGTEADEAVFAGGTVNPVKAAPEIGLKTWDGRLVRTADYRGDAVLVTFIYANCPDICPLIIDNLVRVKKRLGAEGKRLRIVAVSVDPVGDTPASVRRFLARHKAQDAVDYAVGSKTELERVWARWGISARANPDDPALIEHSGTIWGLDTKGRRVTFYPAVGFDADDIAKDMRVVLSE